MTSYFSTDSITIKKENNNFQYKKTTSIAKSFIFLNYSIQIKLFYLVLKFAAHQ